MRMPRWLDASLVERGRLKAQTQSAEINLEPISTASVTLDEKSAVQIRDFVEFYTVDGSAGIYRVTSKESGYGTGADVLRLEHGVCVLGDALTPEEGTLKGTPRAVLAKLLEFQTATAHGRPMWTLGDAPDEGEVEIEYTGAQTLQAVIDAVAQADGYALEFDQSGFPWIMHLRRTEDTPSCEGRLARNVISARVSLESADLCTRVECDRLDGGYMQLEENPPFGIVIHRLSFAEDTPKDKVEAVCREYLEARKEPAISVEIDGLELSRITGEPLDSFRVGRMMRLALPDYGVTVVQRIISISYADVRGRPESVRINLANKVRDAASDLAQTASGVRGLQSTTAGLSRTSSTHEKEITNLKATAEGITEINGKMTAWFNAVEIDLNAEEAQLGALASREEVTSNTQKINTAMLILDGDTETGGSRVGLVARVEEHEGWLEETDSRLSAAELILEGDPGSATAGLIARVDANEALIVLQADELGTMARIKADVTYVDGQISAVRGEFDDLIVDAIAEINYAVAGSVSTKSLTVSGNAWISGTMTAVGVAAGGITLGGESVEKTELTVVTEFTQASTKKVTLLTTEAGADVPHSVGAGQTITFGAA